MPEPFVKYIVVDNDGAQFDGKFNAIVRGPPEIVYPLLCPLHAHHEFVSNDLARVDGFISGYEFHVQLLTIGENESIISPHIFTYSEASRKSAYFTMSGTANNPTFTFDKIE